MSDHAAVLLARRAICVILDSALQWCTATSCSAEQRLCVQSSQIRAFYGIRTRVSVAVLYRTYDRLWTRCDCCGKQAPLGWSFATLPIVRWTRSIRSNGRVASGATFDRSHVPRVSACSAPVWCLCSVQRHLKRSGRETRCATNVCATGEQPRLCFWNV